VAPSPLEIALTAGREAAALLRRAEGNVGRIESKSNLRDLVTEWDTRAEDLIRRRLDELAPGVPILGEEGGESGDASADRWWLVDPIDGTVNFSHGLPLYSISIAFERGGAIEAAVVIAPALGWEFRAEIGGGAFLGDRRLAVSTIDSLEQAMLVTGFPYDRATTRHNFAEWEHFQIHAGACRRLGAASLDLCMVGAGWIDGYWETRLSAWDLAAGSLIVSEAGGRVTGITGGAFDPRSGAAIASNGAIHGELLAGLAEVDGQGR
jgi:myo-inositol-1(or 4)-monophosphatase